MNILVSKILPNPEQPRTNFDQDELEALAQTIKENGLIHPIVVEKHGDQYILVDGERRWRAVKLLKQKTIEAIIRSASNHRGEERRTLAVVANLQHSDMTPLEKARAFKSMKKSLGTQERVAEQVGLSMQTISVALTLLDLEPQVQRLFDQGKIPPDPTIIFNLNKLGPDRQVDVAFLGATRGWRVSSWRKHIKRLIANKEIIQNHPGRKPVKEIKIEGHFDALALVPDWKQLPANIQVTTKLTCQACALYDVAGPESCRQCPLPQFLNKLQGDKS